MPIRAVLFDKDGTLFDFFATWMPAYEAIALETAGGDAGLAHRLLILAGWEPHTGRVAPRSILAAGTYDEMATLWARETERSDVAELVARYEAYCRDHGTA